MPDKPSATATTHSSPTSEYEYGPVEIFVISVGGDPLDKQLWASVREHTESGHLNLVDVVVVHQSDDGIHIAELEEHSVPRDTTLDLICRGLLAEEDIAELVADFDDGHSAIIVAVEHAWAKKMATQLSNVHGTVTATHRIAAPAVNELAAILQSSSEQGEE